MTSFSTAELTVCKLVAEVHSRGEWTHNADIAEAVRHLVPGCSYNERNVTNALHKWKWDIKDRFGGDTSTHFLWDTVRNRDGWIVGADQGGTGGRDSRVMTELGQRPRSEYCPLGAMVRHGRIAVDA